MNIKLNITVFTVVRANTIVEKTNKYIIIMFSDKEIMCHEVKGKTATTKSNFLLLSTLSLSLQPNKSPMKINHFSTFAEKYM